MNKYGESKLSVNGDGWTSIMVKEVKKKHTNNERTYNTVRADIFNPVDAKFGMIGIRLLYKYLYDQIWGE